jgi:regulator of cell morphogenesis and NO signaling
MLDANTTVARAVLEHSECAAVFQRHRIDYCCKGGRSIAAACQDRGIDERIVLADLQRAIDGRSGDAPRDVARLSAPALIAYIVSTHHDYLRQALPFVRALAAKVARVHGEHQPRLRDVDAIVAELAAALEPHLEQEEAVTFPAMLRPESNRALIAVEVSAAREDHAAVGALLARLRAAADDFAPPDWACTSYRTLFAELEALEADVLQHVHLENNVLLPRFEADTA